VPLAFVVDDQALMNVFFEGGYGVGLDGLQLSLSNLEAAAGIADAINRCSTAVAGR
jgi:hypothetical protein